MQVTVKQKVNGKVTSQSTFQVPSSKEKSKKGRFSGFAKHISPYLLTGIVLGAAVGHSIGDALILYDHHGNSALINADFITASAYLVALVWVVHAGQIKRGSDMLREHVTTMMEQQTDVFAQLTKTQQLNQQMFIQMQRYEHELGIKKKSEKLTPHASLKEVLSSKLTS